MAVMNPSYPVYVDDSVIDGRAGDLVDGKWSRLHYLGCGPENKFLPSVPDEKVDIIFLCSPITLLVRQLEETTCKNGWSMHDRMAVLSCLILLMKRL